MSIVKCQFRQQVWAFITSNLSEQFDMSPKFFRVEYVGIPAAARTQLMVKKMKGANSLANRLFQRPIHCSKV